MASGEVNFAMHGPCVEIVLSFLPKLLPDSHFKVKKI